MLWRALEGHDRALRVLEGQRALKSAEGPRRALKGTKGHPRHTQRTPKGHAKGIKNFEGPLPFRLVGVQGLGEGSFGGRRGDQGIINAPKVAYRRIAQCAQTPL